MNIAYEIVRDIAYNEVRKALLVRSSKSRTLYRVQRDQNSGFCHLTNFGTYYFFVVFYFCQQRCSWTTFLFSFFLIFYRCLCYRTTIAHHRTRSGVADDDASGCCGRRRRKSSSSSKRVGILGVAPNRGKRLILIEIVPSFIKLWDEGLFWWEPDLSCEFISPTLSNASRIISSHSRWSCWGSWWHFYAKNEMPMEN